MKLIFIFSIDESISSPCSSTVNSPVCKRVKTRTSSQNSDNNSEAIAEGDTAEVSKEDEDMAQPLPDLDQFPKLTPDS